MTKREKFDAMYRLMEFFHEQYVIAVKKFNSPYSSYSSGVTIEELFPEFNNETYGRLKFNVECELKNCSTIYDSVHVFLWVKLQEYSDFPSFLKFPVRMPFKEYLIKKLEEKKLTRDQYEMLIDAYHDLKSDNYPLQPGDNKEELIKLLDKLLDWYYNTKGMIISRVVSTFPNLSSNEKMKKVNDIIKELKKNPKYDPGF